MTFVNYFYFRRKLSWLWEKTTDKMLSELLIHTAVVMLTVTAQRKSFKLTILYQIIFIVCPETTYKKILGFYSWRFMSCKVSSSVDYRILLHGYMRNNGHKLEVQWFCNPCFCIKKTKPTLKKKLTLELYEFFDHTCNLA